MATNLSPKVGIASGVTWVDIYERPTTSPKTLSNIKETDWVNIGGFREGTFNFTGDEMETTDQKYENGQVIVSTTKDGTYNVEGALADISAEIVTKLLNMKKLTLTPVAGGYMEKRDAYGYGDKTGLVENLMVRFRFEQGYWDSIIYPKMNLSSRLTGAGSSDDLVNISVIGTSSKSDDADTLGQYFVLAKRELNP